nr:IS3 family transposase [Lactobacillus sp. M0396]
MKIAIIINTTYYNQERIKLRLKDLTPIEYRHQVSTK